MSSGPSLCRGVIERRAETGGCPAAAAGMAGWLRLKPRRGRGRGADRKSQNFMQPPAALAAQWGWKQPLAGRSSGGLATGCRAIGQPMVRNTYGMVGASLATGAPGQTAKRSGGQARIVPPPSRRARKTLGRLAGARGVPQPDRRVPFSDPGRPAGGRPGDLPEIAGARRKEAESAGILIHLRAPAGN